jgi:hypothetical protein
MVQKEVLGLLMVQKEVLGFGMVQQEVFVVPLLCEDKGPGQGGQQREHHDCEVLSVCHVMAQ